MMTVATCMLVASKSPMQNTYLGSVPFCSLFLRLYTTEIVCVDSNNMHFYAFIVLHMHKNAIKCIFGLHMQMYTHIYTYLHEDTI